MGETEPLWNRARVAAFLKVPERTVEIWRYQGKGPPAVRIGKHVRYVPDQVREWVQGLQEQAKPHG